MLGNNASPKRSESLKELGRAGVGRRSFLSLVGGAVAFAALPALTSCSSGGGAPQATTSAGMADATSKLIPSYIPLDIVKPDIPSVNGTAPGFTKSPSTLVKSVQGVPGKGGSYTVMTPAWGAIPQADNSYYQAVNERLGTKLNFQVSDGNTYGDKIQTVLASPKDVPGWMVIPSWNIPPRFGQAVKGLFTDLSEYLAGDKIKKYPNLANIPTAAWKYSCFEGGLYGLPYPSEQITDAFFYRKDLFDEMGLEQPKSADEYIAIAKEITDPAKNRWGSEEVWTGAQLMHGASNWKLVDGKLQSRFESDEYRAALEWGAKLFASGAVHPDAVAGTQKSAQRFGSGAVLMTAGGVGGWKGALGLNLPSNPKFQMQPMDFFAPDGGKPTLYRGSPAAIFSFIKKTDDASKVEEMLALANFAAAPFGTEENMLIVNGVEGIHYTLDTQNAPQATAKGKDELISTYAFLANSPVVNNEVQYPGYVKAKTDWEIRQAPYVVDPLFYGLQIQEPSKFGSLGKPFDDLSKDILRGRKSISELDAAVATWKKNGGDELREFYAGFLNA